MSSIRSEDDTTAGIELGLEAVDKHDSGIDLQLNSNSEETKSLKDSNRAWFVCFSAFLIQVIYIGILHVFGIFFVAFLEDFKCSKAKTAWVGSAAYGITMIFGPLASTLINKYGNQAVTISGSVICVCSMVASSFAPNVETLFITFSLCYGFGACLAYTPTMCIAGDYFDKYVTIATGFMVSGSSFGTLTLSPIAQALLDAIGWRHTFRVLAGFGVLVSWCGYAFKPLSPKAHTPVHRIKTSLARRIMADLQLWKNKVHTIFVIAVTFVQFGFYIPYVHLVSHAEDIGIPPETGSMLLMVLGGSTAVGRIMFGKIVDLGILHRLHMHQLSMMVTGMGCMILPLIRSFTGILIYVIVVGLVDGCYVVLLPVLSSTLAGAEHKVTAWGFLVGISSITFTFGPPFAGWLSDMTGSYNLSFHIAGIPIICGGLILFFIPWAQKTGKSINIMTAAKSFITRDSVPVVSDDTSERPAALPRDIASSLGVGRDREDGGLAIASINSYLVVDLNSLARTEPRDDRTGSLPKEVIDAISTLKKHSNSLMELGRIQRGTPDSVSLVGEPCTGIRFLFGDDRASVTSDIANNRQITPSEFARSPDIRSLTSLQLQFLTSPVGSPPSIVPHPITSASSQLPAVREEDVESAVSSSPPTARPESPNTNDQAIFKLSDIDE